MRIARTPLQHRSPALTPYFIALLLANCAVAHSGRANADVVALWTGDGTANDSVGPNSGALQSGVTFGPGVVGQAFRFNGSSYVQAPTLGLPTGNHDRTLALWFNVQNFNAGESFFAGYGQFGTETATYALGADESSRVFFSQWGSAVVGPVVQTQSWHHLAVTNVGNSATLYLDGNQVGSRTFTFGINTSGGSSFDVGRIPGSIPSDPKLRQLDGFVDDVRLYDRALSTSEIKSLASVPEPSALMLLVFGAVGLAAGAAWKTWRQRRR